MDRRLSLHILHIQIARRSDHHSIPQRIKRVGGFASPLFDHHADGSRCPLNPSNQIAITGPDGSAGGNGSFYQSIVKIRHAIPFLFS